MNNLEIKHCVLTLSLSVENNHQIQWRRTFGKLGDTIKALHTHVIPFCKLVDQRVEKSKHAESVLRVLEQIREKYHVVPGNFIKVVIYSLPRDTVTTNFAKLIPIDKVEFRKEVESALARLPSIYEIIV